MYVCMYVSLLIRTKRLAPVLIKEITRRVNQLNIWQAVYTAGDLPGPARPIPFLCVFLFL